MTSPLSDAHRTMLERHYGLAPEVIAERGYRTSTGHSELKSLGIRVPRVRAEGLLLPLWGVDGQPAQHLHSEDQRTVPLTIFRPDRPDGAARPRKYLNPARMHMRLDCPPRCQPDLQNIQRRLFITEGLQKADALAMHGACALALLGVACWRGRVPGGGLVALPDWNEIALNREIAIVYDSDVMTNPRVAKQLQGLTAYLTYKGATVLHAFLPSPDGDKVGVDDYLLSHTLADLEALLEPPRTDSAGPRPPGTEWQAGLLASKSGMPLETFGNLQLCIAHSQDAARTLWYNLVKDCAMVGDVPLSDAAVEAAATAIEAHVRLPIRHLSLVRTAIVAQCRLRARDPIKDWLESLPPWDGQTRLLTWLPTYTGAVPTAYSGETGQLLLVSMVARGLQPGCQCRSVIVLMGEEDIGKSRLVKLLASEDVVPRCVGLLRGQRSAHADERDLAGRTRRTLQPGQNRRGPAEGVYYPGQ